MPTASATLAELAVSIARLVWVEVKRFELRRQLPQLRDERRGVDDTSVRIRRERLGHGHALGLRCDGHGSVTSRLRCQPRQAREMWGRT